MSKTPNGNVPAESSFLKVLESGGSLDAALGMNDEHLAAIAGLATAFYNEGKLESALKLMEGLTGLRPENGDYWSALGAILTRMEQHDQGIPALSLALHFNPKDTAALVNRGECYIGLGDVDHAADDFEAAMLLDPKQQDPAANRARQLAYGFTEFFVQCQEAGLDTVEVEDD